MQLKLFILVLIMLGRISLGRVGSTRLPVTFNSLLVSLRGNSSSNIGSIPSSSVVPFENKNVHKTAESIVFRGYRNILRRDYQLPNGKSATYDILTQRHLSVVVFVWNSTSSTTTLIREYHPGPEQFLYGTVAGMYESSKHSSPLEASQHELEEEAHLQTQNWIPLLDSQDTSMSFDKYSTNRFFPYLALDCTAVANPRSMDDEELITVEHGVPYARVMELISSGQMNVVSSYAILLGVRKLRELGIKVE